MVIDFAYKRLPRFDTGKVMDRGSAVTCKCHRSGCRAKIDRGSTYLCWQCGWYYCPSHLTIARTRKGELVELECFAGVSAQVCDHCVKGVIRDFEAIDWND